MIAIYYADTKKQYNPISTILKFLLPLTLQWLFLW